jgi:hypothetical protein
MPGFDRTGPMGQGPMTGGGRGVCNPANTAGAGAYPYPARPTYGAGRPRWGLRLGRGGGRGGGRGFGRGGGRGRGRW